MLYPIQKAVDSIQAEEVSAPLIPKGVVEWLQVRFNYSFQRQIGTIEYLKAKGHSDEFILGFIEGLETASQILDTASEIRKMNTQAVGSDLSSV